MTQKNEFKYECNVFSHKMLTLPKYLKFKICTYLKHVQISNMQQTAKYWYHLLDQDEFWSFKALNDYGDIAKTKPSYMTGRNWYYNLEQTGTLYAVEDWWRSTARKLIRSHVKHYRYCNGRHYYIDLWGQLFYKQDFAIESESDYGLHVTFCPDGPNTNDRWYNNMGTSLSNVMEYQKVELLAPVTDVRPTNIGDFILVENQVYYIGSGNSVHKNVKFIGGNESLCFTITSDSVLYFYDFDHDQINLKFVAVNVIKAECYHGDDGVGGYGNIIYYTNKYGDKFEWSGNNTEEVTSKMKDFF